MIQTTGTGCLLCPKSCGTYLCQISPSQVQTNFVTLPTLPHHNYFLQADNLRSVTDFCFSTGSHDTMSYCLDITSPLVRSESDTFRILDGLFYCVTRPAIYRWATTQVRGLHVFFSCYKPLVGYDKYCY